MKGIILAGGMGTRLYPLTKGINKHLLPVGKYPMVYHPIYKLRLAGIQDILIISSKECIGDIIGVLGSGQEFNANFTYKVQEQPGGIAQALGLAENFANAEPLAVILGDNLFLDDLKPYIDKFLEKGKGAQVLLKEVDDPTRCGVAEVNEDRIISITEKPQNPKSKFAVTGIYMYDSQVFDIIRTLKPSQRGELEITDVNNKYIKRKELTYDILQGWWIDAGTHESLLLANQLAIDSKY